MGVLLFVFPAFLTTVCFSMSAVMANRSQQEFGPTLANLGRLVLGLVFLALWAFAFGQGFGGAGLHAFLVSGVLGMGLGDMAFFAALPFVGSRLTTMLNQCLAVPVAIFFEWLWLGTRLSGSQFACIATILGGIVLALAPTPSHPPRVRVRGWGIAFGVLAATGQGLGAVFSRKGFELATAAGEHIDGLTVAFQRTLGGLVLTGGLLAALWWMRRGGERPVRKVKPSAYLWIVGNAFAGPILGMSSYQWALATTPSGVVLPITATTPLVVIPFAYWLEGERPSRQSLIGGTVAVAGAVALALVS